jgi:hypothetical protein
MALEKTMTDRMIVKAFARWLRDAKRGRLTYFDDCRCCASVGCSGHTYADGPRSQKVLWPNKR